MTHPTQENKEDWEQEFDKLPQKKVGQHHYKRTRNLKDFIYSLLKSERKNYDDLMKEIKGVLAWADELGIEENWPKDLHPVDVLEKYIFPELERKQKVEKVNSADENQKEDIG